MAAVVDVPGWSDRYDTHIDSWAIPASKTKREQLAIAYVRDGYALLDAVYDQRSPVWLREISAVQTLRVVLLQNFLVGVDKQGREVIRRREKSIEQGGDGLPPGQQRIASPYDTDTRWAAKGDDLFWNGFKLHITEACTDEAVDARARPNLITNVATTASTVPDVAALAAIHARLDERGLLPAEHLVDSGYASAANVAGAKSRHGITLITPALPNHSAQASAKVGYAAENFSINWRHQQVTCPQGHRSSAWSPATQRGKPVIVVKFAQKACSACPAQTDCITGVQGRRQLTLHPSRTLTETLHARRAEQASRDWQASYALRAGVEGTIHQAVAVTASRHARSLGGTTDLDGRPMIDLEAYRQEFNDSLVFVLVDPAELDPVERAVFDMTSPIVSLAKTNLRGTGIDVVISETMRLDEGGEPILGLWDPQERRVILRRDLLHSLDRYAGILLRELGRALTGTFDETREFEEELTRLLGVVAAAGLTHTRA